ncbi:MAG TPA: ABC transporter permease [Gemmatimonadaceae bacterium]
MGLAKRLGLRRILVLARAEVLHVVRDRATLGQLIVVPLVQLLVLSNATTFTIRQTPAYVVDFDRTSTSRGLVSRMAASGYFRIVGRSASPDAGSDAMLRGRATLVLTIPTDFEATLVRTGTAPVHLDVNAVQGSAAGIVQSYAARVIATYGDELGAIIRPSMRVARASAPEHVAPPARGAGRLEMRVRGWYNPSLDYRHYMVPGILVVLVTIVGTLITAQNIAREKEAGTLEQLNVTPITRGQFIAAKLLPFWVLGLIDLGLGLVAGRLAFGIPIRGSVALLFGSAAVYLVVALAIGLWISTIVETQQQAMFVAFFVLMVYLLMSGLLTPIDSMPAWVQWLSQLNPVRHFVTITRAILMKGAGVRDILAPLASLVVYAAVVLTLAVRQYAKRAA